MKTQQEVFEDYINDLVQGKKLSLVNIKNGAAVEAFDLALAEVVRNCVDINTTMEKREITMKVTIRPTKDRDMLEFKISVNRKLAGMEPIEGLANVDVDAKGAGFVATRRNEPAQMPLLNNVQSMN